MTYFPRTFRRLLCYSADNAGIGHSSRALAILTGLRAVDPTIEMLAVTATGVIDTYLHYGIEVVKLPSLMPAQKQGGFPYQPRYLKHASIQECMQLRMALLDAVFENYKPDIVFIDHHIIGLKGELIPWLVRKQMGMLDFTCVYLSRGIISDALYIAPPFERPERGIHSIDLMEVFDRVYVLDDPPVKPTDYQELGSLAEQAQYMGKVTVKTLDELPHPNIVRNKYQLGEKAVILASLGHGGDKHMLIEYLVQAFGNLRLADAHVLLIIISPYTTDLELAQLQAKYSSHTIQIRPYLPDLIEIIWIARLVVARAGYNTIAELLLTGKPALLIPEDYGTGEQMERVHRLESRQFVFLTAEQITAHIFQEGLRHALSLDEAIPCADIDKYAVARKIYTDLTGVEKHVEF